MRKPVNGGKTGNNSIRAYTDGPEVAVRILT